MRSSSLIPPSTLGSHRRVARAGGRIRVARAGRIRAALGAAMLVFAAFAVVVPASTSAAVPDAGTSPVAQLSLGNDESCAVATNGSAFCWGKGAQDAAPPADATFRQISASGQLHACGVQTDGTVTCWGYDSDDQSSPPSDEFLQVATGGNHSCGIKADGTLACWGANDSGESTPPAGTYTTVSAGDSHTCAVAADRSIACWGANDSGQSTPPAGSFLTVSAGYGHTCALQVSGTALCWGGNDDGETQAPTDQLLSVSAGYSHSCGLSPAGRAVCWGHDAYGESTPPTDTFVEVQAGYLTSCGILASGGIKCWGYDPADDVLGQAPGPVGHWTLASGARHSCATSSDSSVTCWGASDQGQDAAPSGTFRQVSIGDDASCALGTTGTPSCWGVQIQGSAPTTPLRQVAAGDGHACGINTDGTLVCWGANDAGQATPPSGAFAAVSVGATHSCAIAANGTLSCWGANDVGQATPPAGTFSALSSSGSTSCAIATNGSLACWGANDAGQATPPGGSFVSVGVGGRFACAVATDGVPACWGDATAPGATPTANLVLSQVAVGGDHVCGLAKNGILVCWGADDVGQSDPPVPGAPVLASPIPDQSATEDADFSFQVAAGTFTDTDPLQYSATLADGKALPAWLRFDGNSLTFSGVPADGDVGAISVAVVATDPGGLTQHGVFGITVQNTNDAPQIGTPIPVQDATEDTTWTYVLPEDAFTDDDLDSGDSLTWSVTSGDGTNLPAWLRFDPATRTLQGTPSRDDIGQLDLLVNVADQAGQISTTGLSVRIARINHPPTVGKAIPEQKAIQDQDFTFTFGKDTFKEVDDGDALAYDATQKDGSALPSWLHFARSDRTFEGVPRNTDVGTLVITITAMDKAGATASTDFALKVVNVNDPPTLVSRIADQTIDQDQQFTFQLSEDTFTDPDIALGDTLKLRANGPDGGPLPAWLSFDPDTATFSGIPRDADTGSVVISVTATDSVGEDVSGTFNLTVNDIDDAPLVAQPVPDQIATAGQPFALVLPPDMFVDADTDTGDAITISAARTDGSPLPAWLAFDPETLGFLGIPGQADLGTVDVAVTATDKAGATGTDTFSILVAPQQDLPSAPVITLRRARASSQVPVLVTWSAGKEAESGKARYQVQARSRSKGKWGDYGPLGTVSGRTGVNRLLKPGTYQLRLRATPAGGKAGEWVEGLPFSLRTLQENDKAITFDGDWQKVSSKDALGGAVRRTERPGDSFTVTVQDATDIGLMLQTGKGNGIIEVCLDPESAQPQGCRTIDLSQQGKEPRKIVTTFSGLPAGEHKLKATVKQGPVGLDSVQVLGVP